MTQKILSILISSFIVGLLVLNFCSDVPATRTNQPPKTGDEKKQIFSGSTHSGKTSGQPQKQAGNRIDLSQANISASQAQQFKDLLRKFDDESRIQSKDRRERRAAYTNWKERLDLALIETAQNQPAVFKAAYMELFEELIFESHTFEEIAEKSGPFHYMLFYLNSSDPILKAEIFSAGQLYMQNMATNEPEKFAHMIERFGNWQYGEIRAVNQILSPFGLNIPTGKKQLPPSETQSP